ncbi:MAG: hypothetical protein M3Q68_08550 [Actinomycetota bacterium]|nr:hypothetical protein [Actinomycetota bacterium]
MTGPVVVAFVFTIAALLTAAYLIGDAELDDLLARWRAERSDRQAVEEWEQMQRDLAPRSVR